LNERSRAARPGGSDPQRDGRGPGALRVRPPDNDEIGPIEALAFDPGAANRRADRAIESLRDDAFEAMLARRPTKGFAIAAFMIAIGDAYRRLLAWVPGLEGRKLTLTRAQVGRSRSPAVDLCSRSTLAL
jgi:hypothetical protein